MALCWCSGPPILRLAKTYFSGSPDAEERSILRHDRRFSAGLLIAKNPRKTEIMRSRAFFVKYILHTGGGVAEFCWKTNRTTAVIGRNCCTLKTAKNVSNCQF